MTNRQRLALRGSAASAAATLVAALSHSWAGGDLPSPLLILGMAVLLVFPGMVLMGGRRRAWRIVLTVPLLQAAFHTAFAALGSPVEGTGSGAVTGHHHHHAGHGAWELIASSGAAAPLDGPMIAAHAAAAVVTIALLTHGERAIAAVIGWASDWVRSRAVALPAVPVAGPVAHRRPAPRALRTRLGGALPCPRGPPLPA